MKEVYLIYRDDPCYEDGYFEVGMKVGSSHTVVKYEDSAEAFWQFKEYREQLTKEKK